ncbi:hypothetical protein FRC19_008054, partial [Serendipita sp. 401]
AAPIPEPRGGHGAVGTYNLRRSLIDEELPNLEKRHHPKHNKKPHPSEEPTA